jgi:hypothetical protein
LTIQKKHKCPFDRHITNGHYDDPERHALATLKKPLLHIPNMNLPEINQIEFIPDDFKKERPFL